MAEKSEMSMSVQSAWEDLVVENPNRRKLEACLVTTILCVVICVMGLLLFVVAEIQPVDNLRVVSQGEHIVPCLTGTCEEFGHRMLGWINFHGNPCIDFHDWACGGRQYDAPEKPFQIDAEMAGTLNANEAFYALFVRHYDEEVNSATNSVHKVGLEYMRKLYDVCIRGVPDVVDAKGRIIDGYDMLKQAFYDHDPPRKSRGVNGFVEVQHQEQMPNLVIDMMKLLNFHPFGRVEKLDNKNWRILPMRLLGTEEQLRLPGWKKFQFGAAYGGLTSTYPLGGSQEAVPSIEVEADVAKAYAGAGKIEDDYFANFSAPLFKVPEVHTILKEVYGLADDVTIHFDNRNTYEGLRAYFKKGYQAMNVMTFKLFMMFSTFLNPAEPKMAPFFKFAYRHQYGAEEPPVRVYRCGSLIENYLQPVMHHFISKYDVGRLNSTRQVWKMELQTFSELPPNNTQKGAVTKLQVDATNAKSPLITGMNDSFKQMQFFFPEDETQYFTKVSTALYDCGGPLPAWNDAAKGNYIFHLIQLSLKIVCYLKTPDVSYAGPVLSSMPTYSPFFDKIFIPYGFSFPPNHHPRIEAEIHHNAPAAYFQLFSVAFKRVLFRGVPVTGAKLAHAVKGAGEAVKTVRSGIECVRKALSTSSKNKAGATQIYIDAVAVHYSYLMYRDLIHRSFDQKKQLRIPLLPFLTQGQIFFIQAAQARCEYFPSNKTDQYTLKRSGASAADKVNIPFALNHPLFADRFGCHNLRPMARVLKCPTPLKQLKRTAEVPHPRNV